MAKEEKEVKRVKSHIKRGDTVMVIAGGSGTKRVLKGQTGKILRFVGGDRVVVEGLNMVTRNQRALGPNRPAGKVRKEAPVHISNVRFYVEKLKMPVKLRSNRLADGTRARGYLDPKSKSFVQIDS